MGQSHGVNWQGWGSCNQGGRFPSTEGKLAAMGERDSREPLIFSYASVWQLIENNWCLCPLRNIPNPGAKHTRPGQGPVCFATAQAVRWLEHPSPTPGFGSPGPAGITPAATWQELNSWWLLTASQGLTQHPCTVSIPMPKHRLLVSNLNSLHHLHLA